MLVHGLKETHYADVSRIYQEGIATGNATFETEAPAWEKWDGAHLQHSRFVATEGSEILGWAALSAVSGRCVYAGVAEVSVYVAAAYRGMGLGEKLLRELILSSEANQIWTLQAAIFSENEASIKLHQAGGFRLLGRREKIGKMKGVWRDTLVLERRSQTVGTN